MIRNFVIAAIIATAAANLFAADALQVFAGIPPVAYLVERIGGDRVRVDALIQPGQDPHTFEPGPRQIQGLAQAKFFFKVDMPFEDQILEKIHAVHPRLTIVDTTDGITKKPYSRENTAEGLPPHRDTAHGESPAALDPHVWLSPPLLKKMAANVADALTKGYPADAAYFQNNLSQLDRDLDDVHAKIRNQLKPYEGRSFFVFHPAFGYFADCYHLKQEAVEADAKQPSPRQLRELVEKARADHIRVVFIEPQFDPHGAQAVADAIGGKIATLNDLDKDVLANLQDIAGKIQKSFGESDAR
jgi:zinc transport system substrate-binding protein